MSFCGQRGPKLYNFALILGGRRSGPGSWPPGRALLSFCSPEQEFPDNPSEKLHLSQVCANTA